MCIFIHLQNQENPLAFIRGESSTVKNEEDRVLLEGLKKVWNDPKKSKDEKWLIDFFVNERFVPQFFYHSISVSNLSYSLSARIQAMAVLRICPTYSCLLL